MEAQEKIKLVNLAKEVAEKGGMKALAYFKNNTLNITNKGSEMFDPVTVADLAAEDIMRDYINKMRPNDSVVGEERGVTEGSSGFTWTLDPIDGTRAFICGVPVWTVLVAILKDDCPILGVIYQPFTQEFFIGGLGVSEYSIRGITREISVRRCHSLNLAFLSSTFPEIGTISEKKAFDDVASRVKLCRYGLDAYAYALLAAGHLDIVVEAGLKPYDIQAPIALIQAAGGTVTNWIGGSSTQGGQILACGDKSIHDSALEILSKTVSISE